VQTVFSHIIRKRFSQESEDVATDALAYILGSSDAARHGMMKVLRGLAPELPSLYFKTQQADAGIRPDMWGYDDGEPRVFIENKFWAGLTDHQPASYLKQLATFTQPAILLVVAPAAREQTLWRELNRRIGVSVNSLSDSSAAAGVARSVTTQSGPILALTSWTSLLYALEHETVDDLGARSDLVQLRALATAADDEACAPMSGFELTDQRTPSFILNLVSIVQSVVDYGVSRGVLDITKLMPQAGWQRIGRYVRLTSGQSVEAWFGIHFELWKKHGETPLWLLFQPSPNGRASEVAKLLEPWAFKNEVTIGESKGGEIGVALPIPAFEENSIIVRSVLESIGQIGGVLNDLSPLPTVNPSLVRDDEVTL